MNTPEKLDKLFELKTKMNLAEVDAQKLKDAVITPEMREKIKEIEVEFSYQNKETADQIGELEEEIKEDVISIGTTISGDYLQAIYSKGRTTWDSKALTGYAAAHPEIDKFCKVGDPSVSIRVKG